MNDLTLNEEALLAPPTEEELEAVANLYYDEYLNDQPIENMAGDWRSGPPPRPNTPRWHAMRADAEGNVEERERWLEVYRQQKSANKSIKQSVFGGGGGGGFTGTSSIGEGQSSPAPVSMADKWSAAAAAATSEADRSGYTIAHTKAAALHLHAALSNTGESLARARAASAHRKALVSHAKKAGQNVSTLYKAWRSGKLNVQPTETGYSSGTETWTSAAPIRPGSATMDAWTSTAGAKPSPPSGSEMWSSAASSAPTPDDVLKELRRKYGIGSEVSETPKATRPGARPIYSGPTPESGTGAWTSAVPKEDTTLKALRQKYGAGSTGGESGNCGTGAGGFKPGNTCASGGTNNAETQNSLGTALKLVAIGAAGGAILGGIKGSKNAAKEISSRTASIFAKQKFAMQKAKKYSIPSQSYDAATKLADLAIETPAIADKAIKGGIKKGVKIGTGVGAGAVIAGEGLKHLTRKKKAAAETEASKQSGENCGTGEGGFKPGNTCGHTSHVENVVYNTNSEDESMLTEEYRGRLIKGIVANCKCNGEVEAALNKEDDNSLLEIAANALTVNAYPPQQEDKQMAEGESENESEGEDMGDNSEENQKGSNPGQSKMGSHCMNEAEWLANAPPAIRSVVQNAMEFEKAQKEGLVSKIVANASNVFSKEHLMAKDLKELQGIAALAVNSRKLANPISNAAPHFAGAATVERVPTANKELAVNDDTDMVPPVINWSEVSKSRKS